MMRKLFLILLVLCLSTPAWADDDLKSRSFDVSSFQPTEVDFVRATVRSMLEKGWEITSYEKSRLAGSYREKHMIEIRLSGNEITIQEAEDSKRIKDSWMESLQNWIIQELTFIQYVRRAEQM